MGVEISDTKYTGIYRVYEEGYGWTMEDDNGGEKTYNHRPTDEEVDIYRDEILS